MLDSPSGKEADSTDLRNRTVDRAAGPLTTPALLSQPPPGRRERREKSKKKAAS